MVKHRRTVIARITDLAKRRVTFSKRRKGLFKKASALCELTSARAAIIVFSNMGKAYSFSDPKVEEIISDYFCCNGNVMPPKSLRDWEDWVEKERDSCVIEEDFDSLIVKYEALLDYVRKKLKDVDAGGDSGVGVCCDSEVLNDDEIDSLIQSFKASRPLLFTLFKDYVRHGDNDSFLASPVNSAGVKSTPVRSVLEGCTYNAASGGNLGVESIPRCSDLEVCGFNLDDFLNLSQDYIGDSDHGGSLTLQENSAIGRGSTGEEATHSDLEACGYNLDDFAAPEDLDVSWDK